MSVRVRFAPSPTGHLHVGNVRTALYNWLFARQAGGTFVLRIEDTDLARSESRYEQQLLDDLHWLGLDWDEGPDCGGSFGPYRQTDRFELYHQQFNRLLQSGAAYHCFCSPGELEQYRQAQLAAGAQPRYSGKCRDLDPAEARGRVEGGKPAVLRLRVRSGKVGFNDLVFGPIEVDCSVIGDFVLARSDGSPQYNFAVVVDDLSMRISHVIRGEGHISNTHRQLLVYEAMGSSPPRFAHLSTILGKDGLKLSKRHGATSIDEFKSQGYLPEGVLNYLALLGWAPREEGREILEVDQLVADFDLKRVNRSPAVFDLEKFNWVNRNHLKQTDQNRLVDLAIPYLQEQGWLGPADPSHELREWLADVLAALIGQLDRMDELVNAARLIFEFHPETDLADETVRAILDEPGAVEVIDRFQVALSSFGSLDRETYREALKQVKTETGQKGKGLFHPIRLALTARSSGPELDKLVPIFERGSKLGLPHAVLGVRERVKKVLACIP